MRTDDGIRLIASSQLRQERFWACVEKSDGCWLWTGNINKQGYGSLSVSKSKHVYTVVLAHRVSWSLSIGGIEGGALVLHRCDVRRCVKPGHLFLGSQADNVHDAASKLRHAFGERNGSAKLTAPDVRWARKMIATMRNSDIARHFDVSEGTMWKAIYGGTWKHVQ